MPGLFQSLAALADDRCGLPPPAAVRELPKAVREIGGIGAEERAESEPWDSFIARIDPANPAALGRKDLKRLIAELWSYPELEGFAPGLLRHCTKLARRSLDRRLARAYWNRFRPGAHVFRLLGQYCASCETSIGLPWTEIAANLAIWDTEKGPRALGLLLVDKERREIFFDQAGLSLSDMQGGFVEVAFSELLLNQCRNAVQGRSKASLHEEAATLIQLAQGLGSGTIQANAGLITYSLLGPCSNQSVDPEHKDIIRIFLIKEFGDPRTNSNQWQSRANALSKEHHISDAADVFRLLNRWLTERSVELFFEVIADTTERKDHWKARRAFWNAYLTTGAISDAWCILGNQAERHVRRISGISPNDFGKVEGSNIDPGHSALLMRIGDLVIADWSHVGAVRFWKEPNTPTLYSRKYYGKNLDRGSGYSYAKINHVPVQSMSHVGKWYRKFSDFIKQETGIKYSGPKGSDLWGW